MNGEVVHINQQRGMVAVLTDDGEVGDVLRWNGDYQLGGETIRNLTQGTSMEVFFQNHSIPKHQLRQQPRYD